MKRRSVSLLLSLMISVSVLSGTAMAGPNDTPLVPWQPSVPDVEDPTESGTDYTIQSLTMRDCDTAAVLSEIPAGPFLVEAAVRNERSTAEIAVMLVLYTEAGQMLDLRYLYGETVIGRTATFQTRIDNSDGMVGCIRAFVVPAVGDLLPLANTLAIADRE